MPKAPMIVRNRLIAALPARDRALLADEAERVTLERSQILFEPGQEVTHVHFPETGTIGGLVLNLRDGASAEAAMIGEEGAMGGVISDGEKPAFTRGIVLMKGCALRLSTESLERAKQSSPALRDHFARYADCLLAQVLQSVACNAVHDFDARLARWLLTTQDRVGGAELPLTHDFISEMLGVQRPYTTRIVGALEKRGAIRTARGLIVIVDRALLERQACECYAYLRRHFDRVLPGVYPTFKG